MVKFATLVQDIDSVQRIEWIWIEFDDENASFHVVYASQ